MWDRSPAMSAAIDLDAFDALTFDCYGTLIDWETGLLAALRPALGDGAAGIGDEELLERYAPLEAELEAGPYMTYREILTTAVTRLGEGLGIDVPAERAAAFGGSVVDWPAFP